MCKEARPPERRCGGKGTTSKMFGKDIIFNCVAGVAVVSGLALVLLWANQDRLLYIPNPPGIPKTPDENPAGFMSPKEWSTSGRPADDSKNSIPFEEENLVTSDGQHIHTWLMFHKNSNNAPTLIYFHGNAGNMGFRLKNAAHMFARVGINVLMMDYRGYGKSTGIPSEVGLNIDALTVLKYAKKHPRLTNSPMILFGRSLGGAVAVSLAHSQPSLVDGLIIENTFMSIASMVDHLMPRVSAFKSLVLRIGWRSDQKIQDISQPILFISGSSDELVPPAHMATLHTLAGKSKIKDFYSVNGGGHNDTWEVAGSAYYKRMKEFLTKFTDCSAGSPAAQDDLRDTTRSALPTMDRSFGVRR